MKISEIIHEDLISLSLKSKTKHGVLFELVDILNQNECIKASKDFLMDVLDRESLSSTGIGYGIAIPHAKSKYVIKPSLVFGIHQEGIDFKSMDQQKAHLFFLIAMPEEGANAHLKILSDLSRKLMHESFRASLIEAKDKQKILELLTSHT